MFLPSFQPKERGRLETIGRDLGRGAKVVVSNTAGAPGDLVNFWGRLAYNTIRKLSRDRLPEYEEFQSSLPMKMLRNQIPTSADIKQDIEDLFKGYLNPETSGEEKYEKELDVLTSANPDKKLEAAKDFYGKVTGVVAEEIAEYLGLSEEEYERLYDAGKAINLSDEEITPLVQSEETINRLGKIARQGYGLKKIFIKN